jgi:hypothetical protein
VHSKETKATNSNKESIEPGTKQKKPYSPPKITTLTAEEAKTELTQKALPGEDATSQLLAAIDRKGSLPGKAKAAPEK